MTDWEDQAKAGNYVDALVSYVAAYDWVTFPELEQRFDLYIETKGGYALEKPEYPNIYLWAGMSERWCEAVLEALTGKRIFLHPTSPLTYLIDGGVLPLPVVKRLPRSGGFKQPHWVPACLRTVPLPEKRTRKKASAPR